ncbi:MAG: DUF2271 domain-containing protein [Myxococcota bacterium]
MQLNLRLLATALLSLAGCDGGGGLVVEQPSPPDDPVGGQTSGAAPPPGGLDETGGSSGGGGSDVDASGDAVTPVPIGATWRVSSTAPSGWTAADFDDSGWAEVRAPLGRGYPEVTPWAEPGPLFARVRFDAAFEPGEPLELRLQRDDAARAYLDGALVGAWNVRDGAAEDEVTGVEGYAFFVAQFEAPESTETEHVLAVELLQRNDDDAILSARLRRVVNRDDVVVQVRTRTRGGRYAPDNAGAAWIETADGAFVRTLGVWAQTRREHLLQWNARTGANRVDAMTGPTAGAHHGWVFSWDHRDASGARVDPSDFVLMVEFSEDNSNEGEPAGPVLRVPFSTASPCEVVNAAETHFADVTVVGPC